MDYKNKLEALIHDINVIAKEQNKATGFCIGNTAKIDTSGMYFTPIRNTSIMTAAGVIVFSERKAIEVAEYVDGKVDYLLVDAEKKIPDNQSLSGEPANVERAVRESIQKSILWLYKGNDLAVDSLDGLIMQLTKNDLRGVGAKKVAILGAGNLGFKLALKLIERGARVFLTRRDEAKLQTMVEALNLVKPKYTVAEVVGTIDNHEAADKADILIGVSQGTPLITKEMIESLNPYPIVIDGGKGTLDQEAIVAAQLRDIDIYRLDVTAAFDGLIHKLFSIENVLKSGIGRLEVAGEQVVSGGLLGRYEEIVVDNIHDIQVVYGMSNGQGDFIRDLTSEQQERLNKVQQFIEERVANEQAVRI